MNGETTLINYDKIGTDKTTAENFMNYRIDASSLGASKEASQPFGLQFMTTKVRQNRYKAENIPESKWAEYDGFGRKDLVRSPCGYKARPLHGIWATAPFLHNGSVPNLYELLSPYAERSSKFKTGSYMFDPIKVGYITKSSGATKIDTNKKGNANTGHIFNDNDDNAIGRLLSEEERYAIIEFIKSYKIGDLKTKIVESPKTFPCESINNPTYGSKYNNR